MSSPSPDLPPIRHHSKHLPTPWFSVLAPAALLLALIATFVLALQTLTSLSLPGCGVSSGCAELAASPWGRVPGIGLPVSIVGLAYFTAACTWWWTARSPGPALWIGRAAVRVGAAYSVLLLGVMFARATWCPYCAAAHAGNLLFWLGVERRHRVRTAAEPDPSFKSLAVSAVAGLVVLLAGTAAWWQTREHASAASRAALAQSTERVLAAHPDTRATFRGRYVLGPADARARIVVFTDFQCPQCRALESELVQLVRERSDTNLSIKHFPLCSECNPAVPTSIHPAACAAAVAAEAAGFVGGSDAFWQAASWIFGRGGTFEPSEFLDAAAGWRLDRQALSQQLADAKTLDIVKADVKEGLSLELTRAPTVFLNGVELLGWEVPDSVAKAVAAVAAQAAEQPPPGSHVAGVSIDQPADAQTRAIQHWQQAPTVTIPRRPTDPAAEPGASEPPVRVVLFGDYQDTFTAEADGIIRAYVQTWPGTVYEFRHFPASSACNPKLTINAHPLACRMARAAESARLLGGDVAFLGVHQWLFEHRQDFSDAGLRELAPTLGLNAAVFLAGSKDARVLAALTADIDAGNALNLTAIPAIYINGKPLNVWKTQRGEHLTTVLDLAARSATLPPPAPEGQAPTSPPPASSPR